MPAEQKTAEIFKDRDGNELQNGEVYRLLHDLGDRLYCLVVQEENGWYAQNSSGERLKLTYPPGMPDSELMPNGTVNPRDLIYVPKEEIRGELRLLIVNEKEYIKSLTTTNKMIGFLERQLKN